MRVGLRSGLAAAVAVLALASFGVASAAAALPRFVPQYGTYPVRLEGASTIPSYIQTENFYVVGAPIKCERLHYSGEVTSARIVKNFTYEFSGCRNSYGESLHSAGLELGNIAFKGQVVNSSPEWINKSEHKVGLLLGGRKTVLYRGAGAEAGPMYEIKGTVIVPITPMNAFTQTFNLTLNQHEGIQEYTKYEEQLVGLLGAHLEMKIYESPTRWNNAALETGTTSLLSGVSLELEG
jgi:hypothetical protein